MRKERPFMVVSLAVFGLGMLPICSAAFAQEAQQVDGIDAIVYGDVSNYSQVRQFAATRESRIRTKIEDYYRKHHDEITSKEEIKLRMIMISGQKDTGNAQAQKALAEEVLGRLASGGEFEQTAQVYSEDSTKDNGGDWGWIGRNTLAAPLEKFAFNMPVGRISNIIDYAGNYYILKVEDKRGGTTRSLTEAKSDIEKKLIQDEAQQIQERWIERK